MSFGEILYQLIFMPLQLMFEEIYYILGYKLTRDPGLSIVVLSLTVNLLVLPLYNRADKVQEEQRKIEGKLRRGVEHIKKTFKGDEQMMMLQTYYRQNNYSPFDAIKGSVSLFLEIPFFVAAYQFLSHLSVLQGTPFGPIRDLGAADGLLTIAGMTVNVLPIIMTVVNLLAVFFFVKGATIKTKIQLYALAFFFLVFLYKSPAGLVFYWTLNNLFNLIKTIIYKWRGEPKEKDVIMDEQPEAKVFFAGAAFMSVLTGLLIPSSVISASPQEFIIFGHMDNPLWYLVASFCLAAGSFILWLGVFYWLAAAKGKLRFETFMWRFSVVGVLTYLLWGKNTGILTNMLEVTNGMQITHQQKIINLIVVVFVCGLLWKLKRYYGKYVKEILSIGTVAMLVMTGLNIYGISKSLATVELNKKETKIASPDDGKLILSKQGKNVIVFMLDGAIGPYVPYIFKEKTELLSKFDGFKYFSNTISYGNHTLFASPVLFGGYEYTPENMNRRNQQLLREKHNEAMLLMPVLFNEAGYKVTVSNLPLVNYQWIPDYTPFKKYPDIRIEHFNQPLEKIISSQDMEDMVDANKRNFYCYGFMKSLPLVIQKNLYASGTYTRMAARKRQNISSVAAASGYPFGFSAEWQSLKDLKKRTTVVETGNTFLAMVNDITHDGILLQLPDYTPAERVDNSKLMNKESECYHVGGRKLYMDNKSAVAMYHVNMASFIQLGCWFDELRRLGVYDNTRIILVADHGHGVGQFKELRSLIDVSCYAPLLMVKDFDSHGFVTDNRFMTNGDVPCLALKNITDELQNPFTGKLLAADAKQKNKQYIFDSRKYELRYNTGNTYQSGRWYSVQNDLWNKDGWKLEKEDAELP